MTSFEGLAPTVHFEIVTDEQNLYRGRGDKELQETNTENNQSTGEQLVPKIQRT